MESINLLLKDLNEQIKKLGIQGTIKYHHEDSRLVRCGRNQISVNTKQVGGSLKISLQKDRKSMIREFSGLSFNGPELKNEIKEMAEILPLMPIKDHVKDLVNNEDTKGNENLKDQLIMEDRSLEMVKYFKNVKETFNNPDLELSGAFTIGSYGYNYIDVTMNSPISHEASDFSVETVIQMTKHQNKELRASQTGESWSQFRPDVMIKHLQSLYDLKTSTERTDIPAGKYNIIFSNDALSEMAVYMSYITLYGESLLFKSGMLDEEKHPIGTKLFDEKFTFTDDPHDPEIICKRTITPTGLSRGSFPLIEKGVLKNLYFSDKSTCDKFDKTINNDFDCANFKIQAGSGPSTLEEVISSVKEPTLFISFIHYMNFTNPTKGEFTGTSRFGTFLIENGKVQNHLYNLRINDNYFNIFNNIEWLSKELGHTSMASSYGLKWPFACTAPLFTQINGVNISGSSFQE